MWCYLCKMKFTDQEIFKVHIMQKHRPASEFYKDDSDSENSEQKENEASDDLESDIDENEGNMIMDQRNEDIGNASSGENCFNDTSMIHAKTSGKKPRGRPKKLKLCMKKTDSKIKTHSKLTFSKLKQKTVCSEPVGTNQQLCIINPSENQETTDSTVMKNKSIYNSYDVSDQLPLPNIRGGFEFNARNILIWLVNFKEMCRTLKFPIQQRLFRKIKMIHKEIFDRYSTASSNEVTSAVMKVYEEFDNVIHKHIASINNQL